MYMCLCRHVFWIRVVYHNLLSLLNAAIKRVLHMCAPTARSNVYDDINNLTRARWYGESSRSLSKENRTRLFFWTPTINVNLCKAMKCILCVLSGVTALFVYRNTLSIFLVHELYTNIIYNLHNVSHHITPVILFALRWTNLIYHQKCLLIFKWNCLIKPYIYNYTRYFKYAKTIFEILITHVFGFLR